MVRAFIDYRHALASHTFMLLFLATNACLYGSNDIDCLVIAMGSQNRSCCVCSRLSNRVFTVPKQFLKADRWFTSVEISVTNEQFFRFPRL
jgi:hypothetical protein